MPRGLIPVGAGRLGRVDRSPPALPGKALLALRGAERHLVSSFVQELDERPVHRVF